MAPLHVLILAAGEGKRMRSERPKLLHMCAGLPLIVHPVRAACGLQAESVHIVVGPDAIGLRQALTAYPVSFAVQASPRGTADAVAAGCREVGTSGGAILVINGDCPGVRTETLASFVRSASGASAAVLAVTPDDRTGYGRLVRADDGSLRGIVEESHVGVAQESILEVNGGIYYFDLGALRVALGDVEADNAQAEAYVTSLFGVLATRGSDVRAVPFGDADEVHGVNSRSQLARAEALLRRRTLDALMNDGVTVRDPAAVFVDADVEVGADTILHPGVTLEGSTAVGRGCEIRSGSRISDSRLGDGVNVLDGCIIEQSQIDDHANLGPYARLRPGSDIGRGAKLGNFVETKATRLGVGSKASHLSYLGNAQIGDNVNIGAGTITCNYDGTGKYETVIDDGAFIGSNTALVAPVRVGKNAYVGAGSTITEDVPDGALGLGRGRQVNKEHWVDEKDDS